MILIVDVKSGRFRYQSGRVADEAKKRKSPAKCGRVGISELYDKMQLLAKFKKILYIALKVTLTFQIFKVVLNPLLRTCLHEV